MLPCLLLSVAAPRSKTVIRSTRHGAPLLGARQARLSALDRGNKPVVQRSPQGRPDSTRLNSTAMTRAANLDILAHPSEVAMIEQVGEGASTVMALNRNAKKWVGDEKTAAQRGKDNLGFQCARSFLQVAVIPGQPRGYVIRRLSMTAIGEALLSSPKWHPFRFRHGKESLLFGQDCPSRAPNFLLVASSSQVGERSSSGIRCYDLDPLLAFAGAFCASAEGFWAFAAALFALSVE